MTSTAYCFTRKHSIPTAGTNETGLDLGNEELAAWAVGRGRVCPEVTLIRSTHTVSSNRVCVRACARASVLSAMGVAGATPTSREGPRETTQTQKAREKTYVPPSSEID